MTTVLPITPRTPSSLLAALCLSPVLAPLNASHDTSPLGNMPNITLLPPSPFASPSPAPSEPEDFEPSHIDAPLTHTLSFCRGSGHRLLSANEARQLTLLMAEYLHPVRASSKRLMQKSIDLAELLHRHGIRWDRHRRVMGTHVRSIWEEGLRLTGAGEGILPLSKPGPMDAYIQNCLCSVTDEPHPLDPSPLAVAIDSTSLSSAARTALTTEVSLFHTLPGAPSLDYTAITVIDGGETARDSAVLVKPRPGHLRQGRWAGRRNTALKITIERPGSERIPRTIPQTAALSAVSMMSASRFRWHVLKRARHRVSKAFSQKRPRTARRIHFGGWEMR